MNIQHIMSGSNEDFRLYYYTSGQLQKTSSSKAKDLRNNQAHLFTSYEKIIHHAKWMKSKYNYQYVVVKYEGTYNSKIIEII